MIGSLRGRVVDRTPKGEIVLDVHGVGYRAQVAPRTLAALGTLGTEVVLHTHLHVREDALSLFGFATREERDCFEALIGARGVGPSLALAILSVHSPVELARLLADGDIDALMLVPGVGRKTATRLLVELKARLDVPDLGADLPAGDTAPNRADLRIALAGLGYGPEEVGPVLRELPAEGDVEELLRAALKLLAAAR
ncbi:MAG: Holliday junction branch migration protein RuvA [Acidimicrobiales bacterium]